MGTKLTDVVERAVRDPLHAEELRGRALQATRTGVGSSEFDELLNEFASGPAELARLKARVEEPDGVGTTTTTTTIF
ncbi:hypothetical protein [Kitasatospora phosalacinea]|nr:hypothetical protein [Kitasatospora phosalacinea]